MGVITVSYPKSRGGVGQGYNEGCGWKGVDGLGWQDLMERTRKPRVFKEANENLINSGQKHHFGNSDFRSWVW